MAITKEEVAQKAGEVVEQTAKTLARDDVQAAAKEILKAVEAAEDKRSLWTSKTFLSALAIFVLPLVSPQVALFKASNPVIWDALISLLFGTGLRAITSSPVSVTKAPALTNYVAKFFSK